MTSYKSAKWNAAFLGVTATAVAMEIYAAVKKDPDIKPWTGLIVNHVPKWVAFAGIGYISVWWPLHTQAHYRKARTK